MRVVRAPESAVETESAAYGLLGQPESFDLLADGVAVMSAERALARLIEGKHVNGTSQAHTDFAARLRNRRLRRLVTYPTPEPGLLDIKDIYEGDQLAFAVVPPSKPEEPEWLLPVCLDEVTIAINGALAGVLEVQKTLAIYGGDRDVGAITHPLYRRLTGFQGLSNNFTQFHQLPLDPKLFALSE